MNCVTNASNCQAANMVDVGKIPWNVSVMKDGWGLSVTVLSVEKVNLETVLTLCLRKSLYLFERFPTLQKIL